MSPDEVKSIRKKRGWSQQRLADELGVDQTTVSRMEKRLGAKGPIKRLLQIISDEIDREVA